MELTKESKSIIGNAKLLNKVLWTGSSIAFATVLAKVFDNESIKFLGVEIRFEYTWLIFGVFTIAHFYIATLFNRSMNNLSNSNNSEQKEEVFHEITLNGGIFFRGLIPRLNSNKARMDESDLTAWLSHLAALFLFLAIIPFEKNQLNIFLILAALGITFLNWIIGSKWAIKLSELKQK